MRDGKVLKYTQTRYKSFCPGFKYAKGIRITRQTDRKPHLGIADIKKVAFKKRFVICMFLNFPEEMLFAYN